MLPSLPTETLHYIIKLSLPVVSYGTYKERYRTLKAFSLVDSRWRALAQEELAREAFLGVYSDAKKLSDSAVKPRNRMHLGAGVSLNYDLEVKDEPRLGAYTHHVKAMTISASRLHREDLLHIQELESLHLHSVLFGDFRDWEWMSYTLGGGKDYDIKPTIAPIPSFTSLASLTLIDVLLSGSGDSQWAHFLAPRRLPALRRLSVGYVSASFSAYTYSTAQLRVSSAIASLAPQLESLAVVSSNFHVPLSTSPSFTWSSLTRLQHLALCPSALWTGDAVVLRPLQELPSSLSTLKIGYYGEVDVALWEEDYASLDEVAANWETRVLRVVASALEEDYFGLRALRSLVMECGTAVPAADAQGLIERAEQTMLERGGSFERRFGWGGSRASSSGRVSSTLGSLP